MPLTSTRPLKDSGRTNYLILITVIILAGLSQGMLLPVLSILLEQQGISSSLNGLNAAALYVGSFAMTLVAERVLGAIGFKKLMAAGLALVLASLVLFPLLPGVKIWFVLRLLVGIGDSAVNYAAQLWVLLMTPAEHRGGISRSTGCPMASASAWGRWASACCGSDRPPRS